MNRKNILSECHSKLFDGLFVFILLNWFKNITETHGNSSTYSECLIFHQVKYFKIVIEILFNINAILRYNQLYIHKILTKTHATFRKQIEELFLLEDFEIAEAYLDS